MVSGTWFMQTFFEHNNEESKMNIGQTRYRLLNLRRWKHWLLLLAVVMLLLPTVSQARTYCGKLWNTVIEVDDSYLFFTPQYKGVDIWAGEARQNHQKSCDDELLAIVFDVDWPSMQPSQKPWPLERRNDNIEISIHASGALKGQTRDNIHLIQNWLGNYDGEIPRTEINSRKEFDENLQLFAIKNIEVDQFVRRNVYWHERADGSVETVIRCTILKRNSSRSYCYYRTDLPQYDVVIEIRFLAVNLPRWQEMAQNSLQLLESFIQK